MADYTKGFLGNRTPQAAMDAWNQFLSSIGDPTAGYQDNSFFDTPQYKAAHQAYSDAISAIPLDQWNASVPLSEQGFVTPDQIRNADIQRAMQQPEGLGIPNSTGFFKAALSNPAVQIGSAAIGGEGLIASGLGSLGLAGATDAGFTPFSLSGLGSSFGNGLGGLFGDPTLGTDIGSGFSSLTNGLSSMLGGTAQPAADLSGLDADINSLSSPSLDAARSAISDTATAATAPSGTLSGYLPSTGGSLAGGGSTGGFFTPQVATDFTAPALDNSGTGALAGAFNTAPENVGTFAADLSGNPIGASSGGLGAGVGLAPPPSSGLSSLLSSAPSNAGTFNFDINGNPSGLSSYSPSQSFASSLTPSASTGATMSSMPSSNMFNGLLKAGLNYGLANNNSAGYNAMQQAGNAAAANYQPFLQSGTTANTALANLNGLNGTAAQQGAQQNWQNTPGYQFAMNQGLQALDAGAAAKGMAVSGNNQRAEQDYGTGLANQYYNQYLNQLNGMAGQGLSAAGGVNNGLENSAAAYAAGQGQKAGTYNTALNSIGQSLFPTQDPFASLLSRYGNTNGGLLSYL